MAIGALALLFIGLGIGFSIGRATAPRATAPASSGSTAATTTVTTTETLSAETTDSLDASMTDETLLSEEETADTTPPKRPKQTSPSNGAVIDGSGVYLRWSKVKDDSGKKVTYSFQIENRRSNGTYADTQVITKIKTNSYLARVLDVRRRWRVWAVDAEGNKSAKSPWHTYIKKYVAPKKKTTTTKSTDTTTTEN